MSRLAQNGIIHQLLHIISETSFFIGQHIFSIKMPSSNINTTRTHHQRRRYAFAAAHLASTMMAFNHCQTALAFTLRRSSSSASAFLVNNSGKKTTRQIITAATTTTSTNTRLFSSVTEQQPKSSSSLANNNNNDDGSIYKLKPRPTPTRDTQYDLTNLSNGIQGSYDPTLFESQLYQWWEEAGCFEPDAKQSAATSSHNQKEPYVLPMPPPNVTGRLHMGHAIFVALQDVLARFHRMRGRPVLWTPGTDHAGIATQLQVEKALLIEGKRRGTDEEIANAPNDEERNKLVPRNEFLERVWQYKEEQGGAITSQLRSLGASADWTRERFTMDPALSGNLQRRGPSCSRHPWRMVCPSGLMTDTSVLVKMTGLLMMQKYQSQ